MKIDETSVDKENNYE